MFSPITLLPLVLIVLSTVDGNPLDRLTGRGTLQFVTQLREHGFTNIVETDRARARAMKHADGQFGKRIPSSVDVTNSLITCSATVGVGSPPTNYTLLIDAGSANTWVGSKIPYVRTDTSRDTGNKVAVSYSSGSFSGDEWTDTVTLSADLVISSQSIGVALRSSGFQDFDGMLGIGPVNLTKGTVADTPIVPTVLDNLYSQKKISQEVLGVYFIPATETTSTGELTFGGYDSSVITQDISYVPLTKTAPSSNYWGFNQSISYGGKTILSNGAGVVDTGTTLIFIASDAFQEYMSMTGGIVDKNVGLIRINTYDYSKLEALTFTIGSRSYDLVRNAQIWPRSLNTAIGGGRDAIYLIVADIGKDSGSGLDFITGYTFLERFYSVLDATNGRIGFASTSYTYPDSN